MAHEILWKDRGADRREGTQLVPVRVVELRCRAPGCQTWLRIEGPDRTHRQEARHCSPACRAAAHRVRLAEATARVRMAHEKRTRERVASGAPR